MVDKINANGGRGKSYPVVFKRYFLPTEEKGVKKMGKVFKNCVLTF